MILDWINKLDLEWGVVPKKSISRKFETGKKSEVNLLFQGFGGQSFLYKGYECKAKQLDIVLTKFDLNLQKLGYCQLK
ncbi:MAG: hypothetical protein A2527_07175 [Candidatus Lambdaproteobacteria bacterium RIFOXYD2_FULL_50_16]|uniref:Uncharacterized protein n=1 Tax=Candidatus Lambdaproteobacteria bacterium RIFOXYD2_FULL_50_16 TaxID=1817772 RepID=A0A1F6GBJ5_9PROT|nr:MAG: hypothetical protein A2527_07175 [Candidatus Lambdaproteobacteria bacterium RIFOXYD2_FULL_50_16]